MKRRRSPHKATCRHCPRVRLLGRDYQARRAVWEEQLEEFSYGYSTEAQEFRQQHPAPTFKDYLISMAGTGWPMSGQEPKRRLAAA